MDFRLDHYDLRQSYLGHLYILSIAGQLTLPIVVYYCPLLFFAFPILIVLIVRTSYSLCRALIVCPLLIVFQLQTLFCLACCTHTLLSGLRTIAHTCISSVACTPWSISSLNCCTRLVAYFPSNLSVHSTAVPDIISLLTCLTPHLCALTLYHL